ncbi:hypothetical protein F441_03181, partial [Phytophthora nicotianae CJ01A1]
VRQSVEWNFKEMKTLWAYIDFKKNSRKLVCNRGGNQICQYFGMTPPTMRSYLSRSHVSLQGSGRCRHEKPDSVA